MGARRSIAPRLLLALAPTALHCGGDDAGTPAPDAGGDASVYDGGGNGNDGSDGSPGDGRTSDGAPDGPLTDGNPAVKGTTLASFTGLNGQITDSVADLAPIGNVREYHNWGWLANNFDPTDPAYPHTLYTPNIPSFGWDWDMFYSGLEAQGAEAYPVVQGGAPFASNGAIPPVDHAGDDPTAAASYSGHGDTMYQLAARYGKTTVPDANLELYAGQSRLSGLGTVRYFEDFNEQDGAGITGDVFAAMASADYDGDQKRIAATVGVKNADPNAMLVMGGLSGAYGGGGNVWIDSITKFLDAMRTWSSAHRGGSFPADVLNVHYYSFGPGAPAPALSPEADGVPAKLAAVVAYRDAHLPGLPVWWTEFGYDTFSGSPLHAPALGGNSAFVVQGQWLVREYLAALGAGIDRVAIFELDDSCTPPDPSCNVQFATSGLLQKDGTKKASWYFLATFRSRLSTMTYAGEQSSGAADVKIFKFKDTASGAGAYVVWAPTSNATVHAGYALALTAGTSSVRAVALADQQANGTETTLTPSGGSVTIDVSETPTIVLVDKAPQ